MRRWFGGRRLVQDRHNEGGFVAACPSDIHGSDSSDQEVTGETLEGNNRVPRDILPAAPVVRRRTQMPMAPCGRGPLVDWQETLPVDGAAFAKCLLSSWLLFLFVFKATFYKPMSMFCTVGCKASMHVECFSVLCVSV